mmetsp:Transcript_1133/g.1703  ORF Transcript_1133/g.1703 Transcript_1133/m.1703 type:complete len:340 (+) Transcript_1133:294-1313(+)
MEREKDKQQKKKTVIFLQCRALIIYTQNTICCAVRNQHATKRNADHLSSIFSIHSLLNKLVQSICVCFGIDGRDGIFSSLHLQRFVHRFHLLLCVVFLQEIDNASKVYVLLCRLLFILFRLCIKHDLLRAHSPKFKGKQRARFRSFRLHQRMLSSMSSLLVEVRTLVQSMNAHQQRVIHHIHLDQKVQVDPELPQVFRLQLVANTDPLAVVQEIHILEYFRPFIAHNLTLFRLIIVAAVFIAVVVAAFVAAITFEFLQVFVLARCVKARRISTRNALHLVIGSRDLIHFLLKRLLIHFIQRIEGHLIQIQLVPRGRPVMRRAFEVVDFMHSHRRRHLAK